MRPELTINKIVSINALDLFSSFPKEGKGISTPVKGTELTSFYFGCADYPVWKETWCSDKIDEDINYINTLNQIYTNTDLKSQPANQSSSPFTKLYTTEKTKTFTLINHKENYVVDCTNIPERVQKPTYLLYSPENYIYKRDINVQGVRVDNKSWLTS
ncbi:MAG: hypothetical protein ACEPO8_02425 [Rhodothermaceae bacterium]